MNTSTGDPYLDEYNNTVEVDNKRGFNQVIDGLFQCQLGSEPFNTYYGFDLISAIRESSYDDAEMYVESLVSQALNPEIEKLISKVEYVKAEKVGNEMYVTIEVTSILNDSIRTELELGE